MKIQMKKTGAIRESNQSNHLDISVMGHEVLRWKSTGRWGGSKDSRVLIGWIQQYCRVVLRGLSYEKHIVTGNAECKSFPSLAKHKGQTKPSAWTIDNNRTTAMNGQWQLRRVRQQRQHIH